MKSYWSLCSCIHYPEWLTEPLKLQPNDITTTSLWHHCSRTGYVTCWCSLVILRGYQHSWVHSVIATLTHNAVHVPDTILYILYSQLGILIPNSDVLRTCLLEPCLHDVLWYLLCTLLKQVLCTCNTQNVWIEYYRFPIVRATPSPPPPTHTPTHPHNTHMHTYAHICTHTHTHTHTHTPIHTTSMITCTSITDWLLRQSFSSCSTVWGPSQQYQQSFSSSSLQILPPHPGGAGRVLPTYVRGKIPHDLLASSVERK